MRRMLLLALALTAALAALTPAQKAEAVATCRWQCGLCGVVCPCTACSGPFPVCPCG